MQYRPKRPIYKWSKAGKAKQHYLNPKDHLVNTAKESGLVRGTANPNQSNYSSGGLLAA